MVEHGKEVQEALQRIEQRVEDIERTIDEMDDVVRGDVGRNMKGLVKDVDTLRTSLERWDRREYMIKGVFIFLSSNLVLTILGIIASVWVGG